MAELELPYVNLADALAICVLMRQCVPETTATGSTECGYVDSCKQIAETRPCA
jgi:hypothetical protein